MNNAKNEGSDASRLALALLKGTAVGIGGGCAHADPRAGGVFVSRSVKAYRVSGICRVRACRGGIRDRRRKIHRRRNASRRDIGGGTVRACFRRFSSHRRRKRDLSRCICRVSLRRGPARGAVRSSRGKAQAEKTREALIAEESTAQTIAVSRIIHAAEMLCSRSATA